MKPKVLHSKKVRHPRFRRPNIGPQRRRLKDVWRKPRGIDNKQQDHQAKMGALPNIGYRNPRKYRGMHPSGFREVLVRSEKDLDSVKVGDAVAVRLSSTIGKRKRELLMKRIEALKLKLLN